ncbi:MAG: iron-containing alcohol dehydrogenase [Spirochaetales bacterium]|nr:iron-containing alcohol dehydrogenase [Spirochaetales bacterium]
MNDFQLYNPVKVNFGKDALGLLPEMLKPYKNILLLYSENVIKDIGLYERLMVHLEGKTIQEYNGIKANPAYEDCMECVEMIRTNPVDLILAVGGGSVIDGGKFISAAAPFKGDDPWDMLAKEEPIQGTVPLFAILTLAATGSEMNCNSIMSRNSTKEKLAFSNPKLYPIASFLDPTITFTLPPKQTANGIIDSFIHVLEQYLAVNEDTDLQDGMQEGVMKTIIKHAAVVKTDPKNYASRSALMWSASMAMNYIITAGTNGDWAAHMIGHELTSLYGVDHGMSVGIVMPALLDVFQEQKHDRLVLLAKNVWGLENDSEDKLVSGAIQKLKDFLQEVAGTPMKLSNFNVAEDAAEVIAQRFTGRGWVLGEKQNVDRDAVLKIMELCK